jgi:hypothetical protein
MEQTVRNPRIEAFDDSHNCYYTTMQGGFFPVCVVSQDGGMRLEFAGLNVATSRSVLRTYQLRKQAAAADSDDRRLP